MIIRDPRETVIRMFKLNKKGKFDVEAFNVEYKAQVKKYLRLIETFDTWPEANRHYFYYEDLINNPEKTFSDLLDFLGESKRVMKHFMNRIDVYSQRTREAYNRQWKKRVAGAMSQGEDTRFHAKTAPKYVLDKITETIKEEASEELFEKYLSHYFETDEAS